MNNRKSTAHLMRKVMSVGSTTLMSRLLGLIRELLLNNFLGGAQGADLFFTAYKIPNSLRKIFAEGALSAALVPSCVKEYHQGGQQQVSRLISAVLVVFQSLLVIICGLVFWKAEYVVKFIAPGWFINVQNIHTSHSSFLNWLAPAWYVHDPINSNIAPVIYYVRILIGFIICISSSAVISAALQVKNHFFISAVSPVLLNVMFIAGLIIGIKYHLPIEFLCYVILGAGIFQALLHILTYWYYDFELCVPHRSTWIALSKIIKKFIPCFVSMSIMEINFFISTSQATYLPAGTIAAIYYANRFMGIPLGVFSVSLATILLPYFSKVSMYAPKRLGFYLFESAKLIFWCCIPLSFLLLFYSEKIFITLFLSSKFSIEHVQNAALFLRIFGSGLFFFSFNKILLNVYYSQHETVLMSIISLLTALANYCFGKLLVAYCGAVGLLYAFVFASSIQTLLLSFGLYYWHELSMYPYRFFVWSIKSSVHQALFCLTFIVAYKVCLIFINTLPNYLLYTMIEGYCFWLWNIPLIGLFLLTIFLTKKYISTKLVLIE